MEIKQPIYWHQGMFLQPQHFQFTDLHTHFRLKPLVEVGLPYFWGIGTLEISASSLANRIFDIETLSALTRERHYLEYPGNTVLKPRSFTQAWTDVNKPFRVFLGVKKQHLSSPNVTVVRNTDDISQVNTRFTTTHDTQEYYDIYSGGPAAEVKSLSFVVHLLWEEEIAQLTDYDILPLALLDHHGDSIRFSPYFIPPCYSILGSPALCEVIKEIRDDLSARAHQLEQYKSPREMQKAEFDASYMVFLLALRTLNRYIPLLYHYTESPIVHPWVVYGVLRQLISELSTFSERCNMLGEQKDGAQILPRYEHEDLGHCLFAAQTLIAQLLNEITIGPELLIVLQARDAYLEADLPKQLLGKRHRFYLILRTETDPERLIASFHTSAKMAAFDELPHLVRRALPGVELIHMPVAPQGLPRRAYSYYFRVETASDAWEQIEKSGTVALDWPDAPDDLQAELVVLRR